MAIYVYRVTNQTVKLSNGETANVAKFAYKPVRDFWGVRRNPNARMHFRSGCTADEAAADSGKRSRWVVMGDTTVLCFPKPVGSFDDDGQTMAYVVKDVYVDLSHDAEAA